MALEPGSTLKKQDAPPPPPSETFLRDELAVRIAQLAGRIQIGRAHV
jgi:hypothetical protein